MDVRKYFDSIYHDTLKTQLRRWFKDPVVLSLFDSVIDSHHVTPGPGVPIGNLTSQFFAAIRMGQAPFATTSFPMFSRFSLGAGPIFSQPLPVPDDDRGRKRAEIRQRTPPHPRIRGK